MKLLAISSLLLSRSLGQDYIYEDTPEKFVTKVDTMSGQEMIEYLKNVSKAEVAVSCQATKMCITLSRNFLTSRNITKFPETLELDDITAETNCDASYIDVVSPTIVKLCTTSGFLSCGTRMQMNDTHVSYINNVKTKNKEQQGEIISSIVREYVVPWHCIYPLEYVVGLDHGHYLPQISPVQTLTIMSPHMQQLGTFPVFMQLMKSAAFIEPFDYPPTMPETAQLFLKTTIISAPDDARLQTFECWATPTVQPRNEITFPLLENYCPTVEAATKTATAVLVNGAGTEGQISSNVFKFKGYDRVYIHCKVKVCFDGNACDMKSSCGGRKKRAISDYMNVDDTAIVSLGPIELMDSVYAVNEFESNIPTLQFDILEETGEFAKSIFGLPVAFIYAFAGIITVIIILILGIVVLLLRRRSRSSTVQKALKVIDANGHTFVISTSANSGSQLDTDATSLSNSTDTNNMMSASQRRPSTLTSSKAMVSPTVKYIYT
jgi:hypothetical protein